MKTAQELYEALLLDPSTLPLTFRIGGKDYSGLGEDFTRVEEKPYADPHTRGSVGKEVVLRHTSGLLFRLYATLTASHNAYEYVVYVENPTGENSPVIESMRWKIAFSADRPIVRSLTADANIYYRPYTEYITAVPRLYDALRGRPTHDAFPYYSLEHGNETTFFALSWEGRWEGKLYTEGGNAWFEGGQKDFATYLKPGEIIRTPLMAFLSIEGRDFEKSLRLWRRYLIDCKLPLWNGKPVPPLVGSSDCSVDFTAEGVISKTKSFFDHGVKLNSCWIDAGWFASAEDRNISSVLETGMYDFDAVRFPNELQDVRRFLTENGVNMMVWFEPEVLRTNREKFLARYPEFKPEWLLSKANPDSDWVGGYLLNLGNDECMSWVASRIIGTMEKNGIDIYREDFNVDPITSWRDGDRDEGANRVGITENKYCQGHLKLWDTIMARFPERLIDSCASGGGRNDLEAISRAVTLQFTDYFDMFLEEDDTKQALVQEMWGYLPYFHTNVGALSLYKVRMNYVPYTVFLAGLDPEKHTIMHGVAETYDFDMVSRAMKERDTVSKYFYGDYYPLFLYDRENITYNGWELYCPEMGEGYAQVCRSIHVAQGADTEIVRLKGLEREETYRLTDFDGLVDLTATGAALMDHGFALTTPESPYAAVILIKKI